MYCDKLILLSFVLHLSYCDWVSEWMSPIQEELHSSAQRINPGDELKSPDDDQGMVLMPRVESDPLATGMVPIEPNGLSTAELKVQIEKALRTAEGLAETLKSQIVAVTAKERMLKEAIANGRFGVTTVTVSTAEQAPRTYLIREGYWTLCNGMVQFPPPGDRPSVAPYAQLFAAPRCIGKEVRSQQDPCVFNSLIKYETIPTRRGLEYREDDYFCLKTTFRDTMEQYLSVPKHIINDTCHGTVKTVADYTQQCGVRIMSEYSYYPHRSSAAAALPIEYCTESDGSCRMIVAWHMTNATVENFEFLKDEYNFKKYFMQPDHYVEHVE